MAQVIFINHTYWPGFQEIDRRSKLQDNLNSIHAKIQNESRNTANPKFNEVVFKKRFAEEMRKQVHLVNPTENRPQLYQTEARACHPIPPSHEH